MITETCEPTCAYCGIVCIPAQSAYEIAHPTLLTRDHVIPRIELTRMGVSTEFFGKPTTVPCCYACNERKRNTWPAAWLLVNPQYTLNFRQYLSRLDWLVAAACFLCEEDWLAMFRYISRPPQSTTIGDVSQQLLTALIEE